MIFKKLCITLVVAIVPGTNALAASWLDDWVISKTVTSPGYYQGQTRGYFSGGSFQARWKMSNENLIDFQPPRVAAGCGGIDLFGGGISFLDADRLMQKLQSVLQAAPAVALDMALKTMCKECSETVRSLEALANNLNGMMQSDCQMAKGLVGKVWDGQVPVDNVLNDVVANVNQSLGNVRDYFENTQKVQANDGKPNVDTRTATQECSNSFKAVFAEGSLIQRIANDLSFGAYTDLLRGLIGDVNITYNTTTNTYDMDTVPSCRANRPYSLEDFLSGSVQERPAGGICRNNSAMDFNTHVSNQLDTIATKMSDGNVALSQDEQSFIDTAPLPVLQTLRLGVMTNNMNSAKAALRDSLSVAMAYYAIDDLYRSIQYLITHAKTVAGNASGPNGDPNFCNPIMLSTAIKKVNEWEQTIKSLRRASQYNFRIQVSNLANYQQLIRSIVEQYRTASHDSINKLSN